ncbi:hypothetical protein [Colwellia piezophila]|uniref:hypothetical protein n=1 Tax=Colwellia piezophila TaxID=211668 RepID=UPI0003662D55|nr:hypothetical protein [Colwellia piezophila]
MKNALKLLLFVLACYISHSQAWQPSSQSTVADVKPVTDKAHNEWLKRRFSKQHQQLIPIVAVADMFFSCNQARKVDSGNYKLSYLIDEMDTNTLAEKLGHCLGTDTMQSEVALNFGLYGCFHQQLAHLPSADREKKMQLVKQAIASLSHEERKKSFTQCVTEQSIHYLK